jgi:hypothetical protein
MTSSRGARLAGGAHQWARLALGLMVVGPSILLVYAWVEVLNNAGYTLVDGYWIGRVPWTPLGLVISLVGATAGLLAGAVAIAIEGGWWRRFLLVPSLGAATLWWLMALGVVPYPRFHGPDPVTFAYTLPTQTILLLLMPAALLAILCLTPPLASEPRTRLRRVPPRESWSEPPPDLD